MCGRRLPPGGTRCRSSRRRRCSGGNVRVGLEDSLFIGRGKLAASNAEQVEKIVAILAQLGLEPATPDEARAMLALKGRSRHADRGMKRHASP